MSCEDITWREKLLGRLAIYGETLADVESCEPPLDSIEMNTPFDDDFGATEGCPFALYTAKRVYFPACYDGREWVASVPRHPSGTINHIGGE